MLLMLSTDRSKHECVSLYQKMEVLRPTPSTAQEMTKFHSNDYVARRFSPVPGSASQAVGRNLV